MILSNVSVFGFLVLSERKTKSKYRIYTEFRNYTEFRGFELNAITQHEVNLII